MRVVSYIEENLKAEADNFILLAPVFMGVGIWMYFARATEPRFWTAAFAFALSSFVLVFINFGNSSARLKEYKKMFAFSTFIFILKKSIKIFAFAILFPILGQAAIVVFVVSFFASLLGYLKFLKYFAFVFNNRFFRAAWGLCAKVFRPAVSFVMDTSLFSVKEKRSRGRARHGKASGFMAFVGMINRLSDRVTKSIIEAGMKNSAVARVRSATGSFLSFLERLHNRYVRRFICVIFSVNYILFFIALGFFAAKSRVSRLDTNMLYERVKDARIAARAVDAEKVDDDYRVTFDEVEVEGKDLRLDKIRVKFAEKFGAPAIGRRVAFTATLIPPFEPNAIGGFDFARYSYFKKLSASGRSYGAWEYAEGGRENSFFERSLFSFLNMRERINARVEAETGKDEAGVVISMTTGDIYALDKKISADYRAAGIFHILSVSGLHMTIIVGFAFFLVRFLLSLSMYVSSKYDTKKIAAVAAMLAATFYLLMTGARIPTERAFIMTALGLLAVLFDRNPISMRFIALSAAAILLFSPESLLNPGFQMSFMAVAALVKLCEARGGWLIPNRYESGPKMWGVRLLNAVWANALSALLIGAAITPFVIHSFNTMQIYGVLGNLFAVPLCTFVVMPAILLAFIAMPFGLDAVFLKAAGLGVSAINFMAAKIGALPYSSIDMKYMGTSSLLLIVFGFIWLFAWRRRWRYFGIASIALGCLFYAFGKTPDVYVDRYGTMFGARHGGKLLVLNLSRYKPNRRVIEDWRKKSALPTAEVVPAGRYTINGRRVSFVSRYAEMRRECFASDIVFASFPLSKSYFKCRKQTFGREEFKGSKGAEAYIPASGRVRIERLSDFLGRRPWSMDGAAMKDGESFMDAADGLLKGLQMKN
jgi:competence protein ComEC